MNKVKLRSLKNFVKQRGGVSGQCDDIVQLMRLIWGGWGGWSLWKVQSLSTLCGKNNDVELIGKLILYCHPDLWIKKL